MKLMIAIPCMDQVQTRFMACLVKLAEELDRAGIEHDVVIKSSTLIYMARDKLTAEAIQSTYSHVLWLDSDMVFDPMIAERLLRADKDFVTGLYCQRRPPFASCVFSRLVPRVEPLKIRGGVSESDGWDDEREDSLVRIAACGFGCVMTSVGLLDHVYRHYRMAFTPTEAFGEDMMFCIRANDLGYELWCDTSVKCGHIGRLTVWPDTAGAIGQVIGNEGKRV